MIVEVLDALAANLGGAAPVEDAVRTRVRDLCARFPIYGAAQ